MLGRDDIEPLGPYEFADKLPTVSIHIECSVILEGRTLVCIKNTAKRHTRGG